jgi:hypothetical protein
MGAQPVQIAIIVKKRAATPGRPLCATGKLLQNSYDAPTYQVRPFAGSMPFENTRL